MEEISGTGEVFRAQESVPIILTNPVRITREIRSPQRYFTSIEECFVCFTEGPWFGLQSDRFNILDFFLGKRELVGLKVFFHMAFICRAGQRQHADLRCKAKDHLGDTGAELLGDGVNRRIDQDRLIGRQ